MNKEQVIEELKTLRGLLEKKEKRETDLRVLSQQDDMHLRMRLKFKGKDLERYTEDERLNQIIEELSLLKAQVQIDADEHKRLEEASPSEQVEIIVTEKIKKEKSKLAKLPVSPDAYQALFHSILCPNAGYIQEGALNEKINKRKTIMFIVLGVGILFILGYLFFVVFPTHSLSRLLLWGALWAGAFLFSRHHFNKAKKELDDARRHNVEYAKETQSLTEQFYEAFQNYSAQKEHSLSKWNSYLEQVKKTRALFEKICDETPDLMKEKLAEYSKEIANLFNEVNKKKELADELTKEYAERKESLCAQFKEEIDSCEKEIAKMSSYHPDTYGYIDKIISALEMGRADSFKEALNIVLAEKREDEANAQLATATIIGSALGNMRSMQSDDNYEN